MRKVLSIVAIVAVLIVAISNVAFAYDPGDISGDTGSASTIEGLGQDIIGIIQVIGSMASVGILIILGIKYMMGSTEEKAEYKKTLIPYVIGAVFIFAASNIAGYIFDWASTIS